jgi:hypothetical protein
MVELSRPPSEVIEFQASGDVAELVVALCKYFLLNELEPARDEMAGRFIARGALVRRLGQYNERAPGRLRGGPRGCYRP